MNLNDNCSLLDDIRNGVRLPSYEFLLTEHCNRQGDSPADLWDFKKMQPQPNWRYVGWCPSASTVIPISHWGKNCPIAVLLENKKRKDHGVTFRSPMN